jgi:hypothetical protein
MNDRTRLKFMKLFGVTLIAIIIVFVIGIFIFETGESGFDPALLLILAPAALIIIMLVVLIKKMSKGVKSGLPIDDELSQRIKERAGYLTCMLTIYFVLALMFYHGFLVEDFGFPGLVVRHAMMVTLFFMIGAFAGIWFILNRRGVK